MFLQLVFYFKPALEHSLCIALGARTALLFAAGVFEGALN